MIEAPFERRRFHAFGDYLRARFGDRVQRVSLAERLVCPHPNGTDDCPFCSEARAEDPAFGEGLPPHEQIRRASNFARGRGEAVRLIVSLHLSPLVRTPLDHVTSTLDAVVEQPGVVAIAVSLPPDHADEALLAALARYRGEERDIWLDLDGLPATLPDARTGDVRVSVPVMLPGTDDELAPLAARLTRLAPDAVALTPELILVDTPEGNRYLEGRLAEPELATWAMRAAGLLERLPRTMAVHPVALTSPPSEVLGPAWVSNRQKVQEAVTQALAARATYQGAAAG